MLKSPYHVRYCCNLPWKCIWSKGMREHKSRAQTGEILVVIQISGYRWYFIYFNPQPKVSGADNSATPLWFILSLDGRMWQLYCSQSRLFGYHGIERPGRIWSHFKENLALYLTSFFYLLTTLIRSGRGKANKTGRMDYLHSCKRFLSDWVEWIEP